MLTEDQQKFIQEAIAAGGESLGESIWLASRASAQNVDPTNSRAQEKKPRPQADLKAAVRKMSIPLADEAVAAGAALDGAGLHRGDLFDAWRLGAAETQDRNSSQAMALWLATRGIPLCHPISFNDNYGQLPVPERLLPSYGQIAALSKGGDAERSSARLATAVHWIWQWTGYSPLAQEDLFAVLASWADDPGVERRVSLDELAEHAREHVVGSVFKLEADAAQAANGNWDGIDPYAFAFLASFSEKFKIGVPSEYWPRLLVKVDWELRKPLGGLEPSLLANILSPGSEPIDPWSAGMLMGAALLSGKSELVEAVSRRAEAIHCILPEEAWRMLDGDCAYLPKGRQLSIIHMAAAALGKSPSEYSWGLLVAMLDSEALSEGAFANPAPEALAHMEIKAMEELFKKEPRLFSPNAKGDNVLHILADWLVAKKAFETFTRLAKGAMSSLLWDPNLKGVSPWGELRAAMVPEDRAELDEVVSSLEAKILNKSTKAASRCIAPKRTGRL